MSFCFIAKFYHVLEKCVFGGNLQKVRVMYTDDLATLLKQDAKVLIVGDGDGRYTCELVNSRPDLRVDYVELSKGMMDEALRNVEKCASEKNINWRNLDIREFPGEGYDLVVTHFLLDCFDEKSLPIVIEELHHKLKNRGVWVCSDFDGEVGCWAKLLVRFMYLFFKVVARLETNRIVKPQPFFKKLEMKLEKREVLQQGFIYSELWVKK